MITDRRRALRLLPLVLVLVAVLVAAVLVVRSCTAVDPPDAGSAKLVPADALVWVSLSTDNEREPVGDAVDTAERFPGFESARDALLGQLSAAGKRIDFDKEIRPWLGKEAALALLQPTGDTASSLVIVDVADRAKAEQFIARAGSRATLSRWRGVRILQFGTAAAAFVDDHLVIGRSDAVQLAIDRAKGVGTALESDAVYQRALDGAPDARILTAYASKDGVRRLLAPQGGVLGVAGVLLDNAALEGSALALTPEDPGARLWVHQALDKNARTGPGLESFSPSLVDTVPDKAIAYLGLKGLDRAGRPLLTLLGFAAGGLDQILQRARTDLERTSGVDLDRDLLSLFKGEVALSITPALPAPILTIQAKTSDEEKTREALSRLQAPLIELLTPKDADEGQVPTFDTRDIGDGQKAFVVDVQPGVQLAYAVFDGRLVISTSVEGIRAARDPKKSLADEDAFKAVLDDRPDDDLTSVTFLDLSQLLTLGEQTGLDENPDYQRIRDDLARLRAAGAVTQGGEDDTTAELRFQIR
jgi:Protein of unknown function (DUF3352)